MDTRTPKASSSHVREHAAKTSEDFSIDPLTSASFDQAKYTREWLIEKILMRNQPGVLGGPRKALKTSLTVDMAVSISSGTPFLGRFHVPQRRRVALLSGESGQATLQETARRVCAARQISLASCPIYWIFKLPSLSQPSHLHVLSQFLAANKVRVVFLDPLYLCLLSGGASLSAANLYDVGPLLWSIASTCLDAGATPILIHHTTKYAAKNSISSGRGLDLDDLAFAGIAEFARQWLLVSPQASFEPNLGRHELLLSSGGSAGHSGSWKIRVEEGQLQEDFTGRIWNVSVQDGNSRPKKAAPYRARRYDN